MEDFMGFRVVLNRAVPRDGYVVMERDGVIAFHDRYSLMRTLYWARVMPRLNALTRAAWEEWRDVRRREAA